MSNIELCYGSSAIFPQTFMDDMDAKIFESQKLDVGLSGERKFWIFNQLSNVFIVHQIWFIWFDSFSLSSGYTDIETSCQSFHACGNPSICKPLLKVEDIDQD